MAVSAPTGQQAAMPVEAWPTEGYPGDSKEVTLNREAAQILHMPRAHTEGDSIVFFRRSDVIAAGDVYDTTSYPVIGPGGSIDGVIAALNRIIDIAIPLDWQEGGTMVIPGHGRISDEADVVEYRDIVTMIRDRIRAMIDRGMTLAEVLAARPTLEFDARYGSQTGPWTTAMFIEAAYRNLGGSR
jgi:glyoxylase-like metal-dependent hydrolase (beta-lactamase superfamily II)